jgi:hypothetical protein
MIRRVECGKVIQRGFADRRAGAMTGCDGDGRSSIACVIGDPRGVVTGGPWGRGRAGIRGQSCDLRGVTMEMLGEEGVRWE